MTWPFGRFKGEPVEVAPTSYLAWAWETIDLRPPLLEAVRQELVTRLGLEPEPAPIAVPAQLRPVIRDVVRAGFRALSHERHPDRGGTNTAMREVLAARQWLEELVA